MLAGSDLILATEGISLQVQTGKVEFGDAQTAASMRKAPDPRTEVDWIGQGELVIRETVEE